MSYDILMFIHRRDINSLNHSDVICVQIYVRICMHMFTCSHHLWNVRDLRAIAAYCCAWRSLEEHGTDARIRRSCRLESLESLESLGIRKFSLSQTSVALLGDQCGT